MRKLGAVVLSPLLVVGSLLALVALALAGTWSRVAFTKKQRRDMAVAGAIRTFVRAGAQVTKEKNNEQEQVG